MKQLMNISLFCATLIFAGTTACGGTESFETADQNVTAAAKVQLISASIVPGCSTCFGLTAQIRVQNLTYDKEVSLAVKTDGDDSFDISAQYAGPAGDGYELWKIPATELGNIRQAKIAVRYSADGQEYWDSNQGQDYAIERAATAGEVSAGTLLGAGIHVFQVEASYVGYPREKGVQGALWIRNLGPDKSVEVVYSTDRGQTVSSVAATYQRGPDANQTELWGFTIPAPQGNVEYAISYTVNGQTYWDNNFDRKYIISSR